MGWQAVVLGVLVMLNLAATRVVLCSGGFSPSQRRWQLALIWLVPIIGAVVCVHLAKTDAREVGLMLSQHDPNQCPSDGAYVDDGPSFAVVSVEARAAIDRIGVRVKSRLGVDDCINASLVVLKHCSAVVLPWLRSMRGRRGA